MEQQAESLVKQEKAFYTSETTPVEPHPLLPESSIVYAVQGRKNRKAYGVKFYAMDPEKGQLVNITEAVAEVFTMRLGRPDQGTRKALLQRQGDLARLVNIGSQRMHGKSDAIRLIVL